MIGEHIKRNLVPGIGHGYLLKHYHIMQDKTTENGKDLNREGKVWWTDHELGCRGRQNDSEEVRDKGRWRKRWGGRGRRGIG